MRSPILLDLSRLLSRADRPAPTGIDRVELAYARQLIATARPRLGFTGISRFGRLGPLPSAAAIRFVEALERAWNGAAARSGDNPAALGAMLQLHLIRNGETALHLGLRRASGRPTYLLVSHHHLERPGSIARLKQRAGARFVALVHDLIPVQLPEYVRPGVADTHARRMRTVAALADAVVFNSATTAAAMAPFLEEAGRRPLCRTALLGVDVAAPAADGPPAAGAGAGEPYFVCVSTIEARKNHLLLLNIWRRLSARLGGATPRLHLVGARGWHNEAVLDILDRSTWAPGVVVEHSRMSDPEMAALIRGARALLFPSFAEGYGLPIAEALALGTPVLCSDLPVFREVGRDVPEYLDALDGPAWLATLLDYADPSSRLRAAQIERLQGWRAPAWADHFEQVQPLIEGD